MAIVVSFFGVALIAQPSYQGLISGHSALLCGVLPSKKQTSTLKDAKISHGVSLSLIFESQRGSLGGLR